MNLGFILRNPDHPRSKAALDALKELLSIATQTQGLARWEALADADEADLHDKTRLWYVYDSGRAAERRDGIMIRADYHVAVNPIEETPFGVSFGEGDPRTMVASPVRVIRTSTLLDAMREVDDRWPCPDWWLTIDNPKETSCKP